LLSDNVDFSLTDSSEDEEDDEGIGFDAS